MKKSPINKTRLPVVLMVSLVLSTPAAAHSPIMGIGGVLGGVLHALLIPEHGLSLLALGLVLGRQQQPARRAGMLSVGLLSGGYGEEELERAGAFRVYRDVTELRGSLDELGLVG